MGRLPEMATMARVNPQLPEADIRTAVGTSTGWAFPVKLMRWQLRRTNFSEAVRGRADRALFRVVKDNSNRVPHSGPDAADPVTKVHAVGSLRSPHWPIMDCEGYSITLLKWYDLGTTLHARPLFGQDELATRKVLSWLGKENRDLDRECDITIEILMKAVEVTCDILQQKRRWPSLTGVVASLQE